MDKWDRFQWSLDRRNQIVSQKWRGYGTNIFQRSGRKGREHEEVPTIHWSIHLTLLRATGGGLWRIKVLHKEPWRKDDEDDCG